jgi:hypothetical protein
MADKKLPDKDSFFGGLMNAFATGGRATMSALQEDLDNIKGGGLPHNAIKAAGDIVMAYQNPLMGTAIPRIPVTTTLREIYGKMKPEELANYGFKKGEDLFKSVQELGIDLDKPIQMGTTNPIDVLTKNLPGRAQYDKAIELIHSQTLANPRTQPPSGTGGPLFGQK